MASQVKWLKIHRSFQQAEILTSLFKGVCTFYHNQACQQEIVRDKDYSIFDNQGSFARLTQVIAQHLAAAGMAQFSKGFGFYLADPFTGDTKLTADLFQGVIPAIH